MVGSVNQDAAKDAAGNAAGNNVETLLTDGLGGSVPPAPVGDLWANLSTQLPAPTPLGLLHRLPLGMAALAAAAALLVAAVLLFAPSDDREAPHLKIRVIDVPRDEQTRPLSREEAAEIFYGTEAPVLLGSDLGAGAGVGGGG